MKHLSKITFKRIITLLKPHYLQFFIAMVSLGLGSGVNLLFPELIRRVLNDASSTGGISSLFHNRPLILGLVLIGLFGFQAVCFYIRIYYFGYIGHRVVTDIRKKLFHNLTHQPIAKFDELRSADLVSRLMNDAALLQDAVSIKLSVIIRYTIQVIVGVLAMIWLSVSLTLSVICALLLLSGLSMILAKRLRALSRKVQDSQSLGSMFAEDAFSGIRVIRAFHQEEFVTKRFAKEMENNFSIGKSRTALSAFFQSFVNFLMNGFLVCVLLYGLYLSSANSLSTGDLTSFLLYGVIVAVSFAFAISAIAEMSTNLGGAERIFEFLETKESDLIELDKTKKSISISPPYIEFKNVSFSYPTKESTDLALRNASFKIPAKKTTAIVGVSGSGKSTILNILLGFYPVSSGQVLINSINLNELDLYTLRNISGYVPQDSRLLDLTIKETICLGSEYLDNEIFDVLQKVRLKEFVQTLANGLETPVGESGGFLSGGQRQRLTIARALIRSPKLLILDEATSALDLENELAIKDSISSLKEDMTQVIITHRIGTIKNADHIIVLSEGRIIQEGSYQALSEKEGLLKEFVKMHSEDTKNYND